MRGTRPKGAPLGAGVAAQQECARRHRSAATVQAAVHGSTARKALRQHAGRTPRRTSATAEANAAPTRIQAVFAASTTRRWLSRSTPAAAAATLGSASAASPPSARLVVDPPFPAREPVVRSAESRALATNLVKRVFARMPERLDAEQAPATAASAALTHTPTAKPAAGATPVKYISRIFDGPDGPCVSILRDESPQPSTHILKLC